MIKFVNTRRLQDSLDNQKAKEVKSTLEKIDIHEEWVKHYRTSENEPFYDMAFDYIVKALGAPKDSVILDVGCGTGQQSIRLAKRGFKCFAVDFSKAALNMARVNVKNRGLNERITIQCEDITSLSFKDETFSYILCWGVLMHVPDLEKAISELSRILKPNGKLVISENNSFSFEITLRALIFPILRFLLGRKKIKVKHTKFGVEQWIESRDGLLLARMTNIGHLIKAYKKYGVVKDRRFSGEFTEIYTLLPSQFLRSLIHRINHFWFKNIRIPGPAFGNIIILEKVDK